MNLASVGPLVAIWLDRRDGKQLDEISGDLGKKLLWWSLAAFLVGMTLGVAQGFILYLQADENFFRVLARVWDTKIFFGFWELAFYAVCLFGYIAWWQWGKRQSIWAIVVTRLLAILAATNLLYHFPMLFSIIRMIANSADKSTETIHAKEFLLYMAEGGVGWLSIHFTLASIAVTGLFVSLLCLRYFKENESSPVVIGRGALISLFASVTQIPVGLAFLLSISKAEQSALMGGNILASVTFFVALLSALWLMHLTSSVAFFDREKKQVFKTCGVLVFTVLTMTMSLLLCRP
ncbi:MAG: hypothetical protein COA78_15195 [Blastopirellula sp.]|nr:MAG: hypothetical protein COA78_15195 [Blastopirellula sp.]